VAGVTDIPFKLQEWTSNNKSWICSILQDS